MVAAFCVLFASNAYSAGPPGHAALVGNGIVLEFSEGSPLGIVALRATPDGPSLFLDDGSVEPTWELVLLTAGGEPVSLDPVTADLGGRAAFGDGEVTAIWDRADVPGGTIGVRCTWTADASRPLVYGHIEVDNDSPCRLREVQFTRLTLRPTPGPAERATLVFPRAYGRSWRDPFHAPRGYLVGTREPAGLLGSMEMQFATLYDDAGNGLYWATQDTEGYHKRFVYDNVKHGLIELKLGYLPENCHVPGNDFRSPYPVALGAYRGDWWDAAHLYRAWALQQTWCRRGPLKLRDDVPQWVKDTDVWIRGDTSRTNVEQSQTYYEHILHVFGGPIGVQWYSWVDPKNWSDPLRWPPYEGAPEMCAVCAKKGIHNTPYVNSLQWDTATDTFVEAARKCALLGEDGQPIRDVNTGSHEPIHLCASTKLWHDTLVNACVRLVRDCHVSGIYYDQLGGQCSRPCWSTDHGHPVGGGTYATDGLRELCERTRVEMRKVNPNAALSGEGQHELLLDVTDMRLTHYNVWPGWVNLWAAVYGDMTATFGRTITWTGNRGDELDFYGRCGNTFVSGIQFARLWPTPAESRWLTAPEYAEQLKYFKLVVDLRRAAKEYLEFGWLQRPVKFLSEVPQLSMTDAKNREMKIAAVLDSAWASHDGKLAFVLTNVSDGPQTIEWKADLSRYEIAKDKAYSVCRVMPTSRRGEVPRIAGAMLRRTDHLPAHSALVLEVDAVSP